jgi:hypothetical protein
MIGDLSRVVNPDATLCLNLLQITAAVC